MSATRLDLALVERGLVGTRTKAQRVISSGAVSVDGIAISKASHSVGPESTIVVAHADGDVGRGAIKLRAALDYWAIPVREAVCVDIGASTGGFTQILRERGATHVVALDVGHGQLDASLQNDVRVTNLEGVHAGSLDPAWWESQQLPVDVSVVVADVSFISLQKVIPALVSTFGVHSHYVFLIKPQFEVGRTGVSGGIVKDATKREQAVRKVMTAMEDEGITPRGLITSPVTGEKGNVEYLAYASATPSVHPAQWDQMIPDPTRP